MISVVPHLRGARGQHLVERRIEWYGRVINWFDLVRMRDLVDE